MDVMNIVRAHGVIPVLGLKDPDTAPQVAAALRKASCLCWKSPCGRKRPWTA